MKTLNALADMVYKSPVKHKKCPKCNEWKGLAEYYKCSTKASGVQTKCKACCLILRKRWRESEAGRALANKLNKEYHARKGLLTRKVRDALPESRQRHRDGAAAYRKRFPEKERAHLAVQRALKSGTMVRGSCAVCGGTKAEGHHEDYSKPLDIVWLCRAHHNERHQEIEGSNGI